MIDQELELLMEGLQIEVQELTSDKDKLRRALEESQSKTSELHQLQNLRALNQSLSDELREANQKNLEFVYKIEKLEKEQQDRSQDQAQAKLVEAMRNKIEKLLKERELAAMKERDMENECKEVKALNESLQNRVTELEEERSKLLQEHGELCLEYGKLRKRLQQDEDKAAFREFVAVKRELIAVKNENEILRLKVRTSSGTLPMLKEELPPPSLKPLTKKGKKKLLAITLAHGTGNSTQ